MKDHFRLEILGVILIKVLLLVGLWFVVFRPEGRAPAPQASIEDHFQLPTGPKATEFKHERR